MRSMHLKKLLMGDPEPTVWALLLVPGRLPKDWKERERTFNGAMFYRAAGRLLVRCRGLQDGDGVRWWHVLLARELEGGASLSLQEVREVQLLFFPQGSQVLHVFHAENPDCVHHLWMRVDGSALPPLGFWMDDQQQEDRAATYEGEAPRDWE